MDSAIRLCYSPLPTAPRRLSSGAVGAATPRASRVHLSFSHGSLSVSHSSKRSHPVSRPFHVNCMHHRFSEGSKNEENDKKIVRGIEGASLVLACVLGVFSLTSKMNPKSNVVYALTRSQGSTTTVGKQKQCQRPVFESLRQLINPDAHLEDTSRPRPYFYNDPNPRDVDALKMYAMAISKSRPPESQEKAEKILSDEYKRWKCASASAESLKMALIELLIEQNKYKEASEQLDELIGSMVEDDTNDKDPQKKSSDDESVEERKIAKLKGLRSNDPLREKIFLYKAIVDTKLDNRDAADTWWDAFQTEVTSETRPQDIPFPPRSTFPRNIKVQ